MNSHTGSGSDRIQGPPDGHDRTLRRGLPGRAAAARAAREQVTPRRQENVLLRLRGQRARHVPQSERGPQSLPHICHHTRQLLDTVS